MKVKLCSAPNCNAFCVAHSSYCAKHKALSDKARAERKPFESASRFADYSDPRWRKLKAELLKDSFCAYCGAREFLQVHHIVPVRENPELFLCRENCMVLCRSCHAAVTAREIQHRKRRDR